MLNFEDFNSTEQPEVTDLLEISILLDAMLVGFVAAFAAMFLLLAAALIASGRGFAQLGLSPVVSPPLPPGFPSEGNSRCRVCCHGCFQSPGWMLAATCRDFFKRVLLMAAAMIAAIEGHVCEPGSECTRLLVVFELPCLAGTGSTCEGVENVRVLALSEQVSPCQGEGDPVSGTGAESEFHFTVSETSGPVAGAGAENGLQFNVSETIGPVAGTRVENELPDHETGFVIDFLEDVASRGQVRRHAPLFQQTKEDKKFCLEIFGNGVSRNGESRGASGVIFENDVDVSVSLVPDGAFAVLVDFDVGRSGSCPEARNEAAIVPLGCSSSTGCGRKRKRKRCEKGAVLCQPWERVHHSCSLFSRCRAVGCSASGC